MPTIEINFWTFLIFFGSFQALIIAAILFTSKRFRRKSNFFLGLLLVSLGLINMTSGFFLSGAEEKYDSLPFWPTFIVTLIPLAFYFFIRYLVSTKYKWRWWDYLLWVILLLEIVHRGCRFILYISGHSFSESDLIKSYKISNLFELTAVSLTLLISVWSIWLLGIYEKRLYDNYAEVEDRSLLWLRTCLIAGLVLGVAWFISSILEVKTTHQPPILIQYIVVGLTFLICFSGYAMLIRQGLLDTEIFGISDTKIEDTEELNTLSARTEDHFARLKELIEDHHLYRDPELSMTKLALKTGLSNSYLSQIINQKQGQNFFDFINAYRVQEVKAHMRDKDFDHYTILALAQSAGFKSKSTFNSVFKKMTGMTPSAYKRSSAS
jgi:AraC-type DNA-binding domain-containing proteins